MIINTTDSDFISDISQGLVLVDFWATSCKPCANLGIVLEKLDAEQPSFKIVKLNVEDYNDRASELGLMSVPCLIAYKEGQEVNRIVGALSYDRLKAWLSTVDGFNS